MTSENQDNIEGKLKKLKYLGNKEESQPISKDLSGNEGDKLTYSELKAQHDKLCEWVEKAKTQLEDNEEILTRQLNELNEYTTLKKKYTALEVQLEAIKKKEGSDSDEYVKLKQQYDKLKEWEAKAKTQLEKNRKTMLKYLKEYKALEKEYILLKQKLEKSKAPDDKKSLEEIAEPDTPVIQLTPEQTLFQRLFAAGKQAWERRDYKTAKTKLLEAAYVNPEEYGEEVLAYVANTADNKEKVYIGFYISSISAIPNRKKYLFKLVETRIKLV